MCSRYTGVIHTTEALYWIFDALLMFVVTVVMHIRHPAKYFPRSNEVYLSQDGTTELTGPGWTDKRNILWTTLDPFDVYGLITGRDHRNRFWEDHELSPSVRITPQPGRKAAPIV